MYKFLYIKNLDMLQIFHTLDILYILYTLYINFIYLALVYTHVGSAE